jgi:peptidoglycan/xylan/chitin deacetylase (PgdA/CDA1 family)
MVSCRTGGVLIASGPLKRFPQLGPLAYAPHGSRMSVVLLYHDVAPRVEFDAHGFPGRLAARYKLEPEEFEAHLNAVEQTGRPVGLINVGRPAPPLAVTFDDGGRSSLSIADALERHGWRGHFFVITGLIGRPGFLDIDGVRELDRRGHEVGSHSDSHPSYMARLADSDIESEWVRSRAVLTEVLGKPPTHASVPGGDVSRAVVQAARRAGYEVLMTSEPVRRVERVESLLIFGRYPIWSSTGPATAAAYALGRRRAHATLALSWKAKRLAKKISPRAYETLRSWRAGDR